MEKKGSRSVQTLTKGLGTDTKKTQDVANKLWPRGSRRREPNGGTLPKNETFRKPTPQRSKAIDKRPRPRGFYYSGAVGGKEEPGLETEDAEIGSVFVQGSKKQSLNHLLNFHFEPREAHWHAGAASAKSGHRWNSSVKHKYNKEQFLQANCQFIVCDNEDYKQYMNNPDALVNWDLIEQVNIHVLEFPSCPICLYPPIAAKMTRCGHIYCWPCMLHYLALSDKNWRKCPICYEAVHKKDLKSVISIPHNSFNVNEDITFTLMKRLRGSLIACSSEQQIQDKVPLKVADKNTTSVYSKLLLAGRADVLSITERERTELQLQLGEDESCPEKCFIDQALTLLQERVKAVLENNTDKRPEECVEHFNTSHKWERCESVNSSDTFVQEDINSDCNIKTEDSINTTTAQKYFYFYQASDGQHIYLHALNVRMLEHTYGSLEFCPTSLAGKIIEKESGSITEDLRKRLRYLQHLPITCQFEVAEIQLKPPVVTKETLEEFREQIETRRKYRQRRAREEKRREKRIAEEENRKIGKYAAANIKLESHLHFPEFQPETRTSLSTEEDSIDGFLQSECSPSPSSSFSETQNNSVVGNLEQESSVVSFAKMLSISTPTGSLWPVKKSTSTSTPLKDGTNKNKKQSESDTEIEGHVSVPAYNNSFGDAIALALEKAALTNDDKDLKTSGKKKKNKQKKILFSTSMGYSGS